MITDWDHAYTNRVLVGSIDDMVAKWNHLAAGFRSKLSADNRAELGLPYGDQPRNKIDIFYPDGEVNGLVTFIHGGYWRAFDNSTWSHLAEGPLTKGWAVAMPSYTLAPETTISHITTEVAASIEALATKISGPIRLCGHSAGGHLVSRMICHDSGLNPEILSRIEHTVSISGVHDLRPLLNIALNEVLKLDLAGAIAESPALNIPVTGSRISCLVGSDERPEFIRQNDLLANIWTGFSATTMAEHLPGLNHFTIVEELAIANSRVVDVLLG